MKFTLAIITTFALAGFAHAESNGGFPDEATGKSEKEIMTNRVPPPKNAKKSKKDKDASGSASAVQASAVKSK